MPLMKPGWHRVSVTSTVLAKSSKGNMQIVVGFVNEGGEDISAYLATTEAAWPYTEEKLARLGWDAEARNYQIQELNAGKDTPILHVETDILVVEEMNEGKPYIKVDRIGRGGVTEAAPADEVTAFAATFRARVLAAKGPRATAAPRSNPF